MEPEVTRFAPSPSGPLHLGHALAALVAHDLARGSGGRFLVRIEDIDRTRCRADYEEQIFNDLAWLGLQWEQPVWRQSERLAVYRAALDALAARALTYPCFCTRRDIQAEIARMGSAPQGPDGPRYPGTCRGLSALERQERLAAGQAAATRLDSAAALRLAGSAALVFTETGAGPGGETGRIAGRPAELADIVLARKDVGVSYHLAVVVDDAAQDVTLVTRGNDLFGATAIQRLLQTVLGLPAPRYHHHRLVTDAAGRRLAKRDNAAELALLRASGIGVAELRQKLALPAAFP